LQPHQDGAKQLREQYGEQLVCVRYRYNETTKERWKTVELIIDTSAWAPPKPQWPVDTLVALQVAGQERTVRQQVKAADGKWTPKAVVWELPYGQVVALGLTARIVTKRDDREREASPHIDGTEREPPSTDR
jgi:hypothetical protein